MRPRLVLVTVLSALAGIAAWVAPGAHATSYTPSSYASHVVQLVNQARAQNGLAALTVTSGTSEVAASWTNHLASTQTLSHNPDLQHDLETHGSADWTAYGENVGDAPADNPDALFQAYMQSPEHRANILNTAYRYVGVGVVFTGATAWNTLDFVDEYRTAAAKTTAPKSPPRTSSVTKTSTTPTVHHVVAQPAPRPVAAPVAVRAVTHVAPKAAPRRVVTRVRAVRAAILPPKPMTEQPVAAVTARVAAFASPIHVPVPRSVTPLAELAVVVAAAMAGFVGVRWVAAVR